MKDREEDEAGKDGGPESRELPQDLVPNKHHLLKEGNETKIRF